MVAPGDGFTYLADRTAGSLPHLRTVPDTVRCPDRGASPRARDRRPLTGSDGAVSSPNAHTLKRTQPSPTSCAVPRRLTVRLARHHFLARDGSSNPLCRSSVKAMEALLLQVTEAKPAFFADRAQESPKAVCVRLCVRKGLLEWVNAAKTDRRPGPKSREEVRSTSAQDRKLPKLGGVRDRCAKRKLHGEASLHRMPRSLAS